MKKIASELKPCAFCGLPAQYDDKTRMGMWANMCKACHQKHGVGIGFELVPSDSQKERETRHHDCPFCGKQWREYCEDDFPDYCPKCGDKLEAWGQWHEQLQICNSYWRRLCAIWQQWSVFT